MITFSHNAGVYTTSIDPEQQQVTVTGSIDSDILLKKLSKTGKHAEICSNKSGEKVKKNEKPSDTKTCQNKEQITPMLDAQKKPSKLDSKPPTKTTNAKNSDKKSGDGPEGADAAWSGECGKVKKGKGQKDNCIADGNSTTLQKADQGRCQGGGIQVNLSPTFDQLASIMTNSGSSTVQVLSFNSSYPSMPGHALSYQTPSASAQITHNATNDVAESYPVGATLFNSFDMFSDENPNGCSVM